MENQLISVIVPVYNSEKTLDKCLDSLMNQTHRNLEIILVESKSTDRSSQMCDDYAQEDKRIKVIHQSEKRGLSNARNTGLKYASGDYIGYLDSDDWISYNSYEVLLKALCLNNADISCGHVVRVVDNTLKIEEATVHGICVYSQDEYAKLFFRINSQKTIHYVWNKLYRAEIAKKMVFPEGLIAEDVEGFFSALIQAHKIVDVDMQMYFYWYNQDGLSSEWFSRKQMDIETVWKHVYERCLVEKEEWVNYAESNYYRAAFGLLCRLMLSKESKTFYKEKEYLLLNVKKNYRTLIRSQMPINRKILLTGMCVNYDITEYLFSKCKQIVMRNMLRG